MQEPEVGDVVSIADPTREQVERVERGEVDEDGGIDVRLKLVEIVDVREPGFFVVRDSEKLDQAAEAYAIMTEAPLTVSHGYRPIEYKARAWIQFEGEAPKRTLIAKLYKRYEVEPETKARMVVRDEDS